MHQLQLFIVDIKERYEYRIFDFRWIRAVCLASLYLYLKTKKELQKQEKLFLKEFKQPQTAKILVNSQKENTKQVLSGNSVF